MAVVSKESLVVFVQELMSRCSSLINDKLTLEVTGVYLYTLYLFIVSEFIIYLFIYFIYLFILFIYLFLFC